MHWFEWCGAVEAVLVLLEQLQQSKAVQTRDCSRRAGSTAARGRAMMQPQLPIPPPPASADPANSGVECAVRVDESWSRMPTVRGPMRR